MYLGILQNKFIRHYIILKKMLYKNKNISKSVAALLELNIRLFFLLQIIRL